MIGVKTEVVECAPANRIAVLVLRKGFGAPGYGTRRLSNSPGRATVTLIVECAVVCPTGFLRWRMKVDIANVHPGDQGDTERLNSAVEILIIQGVFVMPHTCARVSHFVAHKPDAIVAWIRLDLAERRSIPGHDGRLRPYRRANR